jgi:hypothetical protein
MCLSDSLEFPRLQGTRPENTGALIAQKHDFFAALRHLNFVRNCIIL